MSNQSIAPDQRASKKSQSRFQRLWAEAEDMARESTELDKVLDELVQRVDTQVRQAERSLGESVRLAVHRQLDFTQKKSLLKWQRAELGDWIEEHLDQLIDMGQLDETLQNRLALLRAAELGFEPDENSDMTPVEQLRQYVEKQNAEQLDELNSRYRDEDDDTDDWLDDENDDDPFASSDDDAEEADLEELLRRLHAEFGEGEENASKASAPAPKNKPAFDDTVFKRLFRQTAAALHPDKESDPGRQREKHELMSELLLARKTRDLVTIVRLHEQHASAETALSAEDEQQLEEVLVDYLAQQHERMEDIVHRSPMHQWVFHEFYHKNPSTVKRRIKAHIKKIDTRREGLDVFVNTVKTLKALKEVLAGRYERHRFDPRWF